MRQMAFFSWFVPQFFSQLGTFKSICRRALSLQCAPSVWVSTEKHALSSELHASSRLFFPLRSSPAELHSLWVGGIQLMCHWRRQTTDTRLEGGHNWSWWHIQPAEKIPSISRWCYSLLPATCHPAVLPVKINTGMIIYGWTTIGLWVWSQWQVVSGWKQWQPRN